MGRTTISIPVIIFLVLFILTSISITVLSDPAHADPPIPQVISPPSGTAAIPGKDRIYLTWEEPNSGFLTATGFSLYRSDDGIDFNFLISFDIDIFSFEDTDIIIGNTYSYFLRTDTDIGQSDNGPIVSSAADNVLPYVELLKPSEGNVFGVGKVTVTWDIEDEGSGLKWAELILDESSPKEIVEMTNIILDNLSEGDHSIRIIASDIAGNMGEDSVSFKVDLTPPDVRITEPMNASIHSSSSVLVSWTIEESFTEITSTSLTIDQGNPVIIKNGGTFVINGLSEGDHEISISATDMGGHDSMDTIWITVDLEQPEIHIISPPEGSFHGKNSLTVNWEGSDTATDPVYRIRYDETAWIEKGSKTDHVFFNLPDGTHDIEAEATDLGGWTSIHSIEVTIDTTPPTLDLITESSPLRSRKNVLVLEWETFDRTSGVKEVQWSLDGDEWKRTIKMDGLTIRDLDDGRHSVGLKVIDLAGNYVDLFIDTLWDSIPPKVVSYNPNGTLTKRPGEIEVLFSKEMRRGSLQISSEQIEGHITERGNTATIDLLGEIQYGRSYRIYLQGEDLFGNFLESTILEFHLTNMVSISGRVVDSYGRALEDVTVTLDTGRYASTGSDGSFIIQEKLGNVTLYFTKDGYSKGSFSINAVPGDTNWVGTLKLKKDEGAGSMVSAWISDPINLLIAAFIVVIIMVLSAMIWRSWDKDRFTEVDIEMDDEL